MSALVLTREHARTLLLDLFRTPSYVVWTIVFPAMFFTLFDMPYARHDPAVADGATLAFVVWAIAGVCFYQFGVGIAQERGRPWERYLRTLPASAGVRFGARIAGAAAFACAAAALVALLARLTTPVDLSPLQWLTIAAYAAMGGIPFVLFGIALGYWCSPRAAVPVATALNLLLAYGGGLWMPPADLPQIVRHVSPFLPTRAFADLLWSVPYGTNPLPALAVLLAYALAFGALATRGYRRDEGKRYA
ncbi:MAG TPA: ABC transporter permease [Candidatus Acidoferrales bacterium]|nr:ABC transporter permease [Candidatus Acidoferrales bacterium]